MTRSLVRPLTRSLVRSLVRGPSLDADAAAYIDALVSGGATVTSVQSSAIDTFIRAEKDGGRWDLIKRLYLPIWELAAPNAICMRSLTSGTFFGGVTHGAGFMQGDGSSGYFRMDASISSIGLTDARNGLFYLSFGTNTKTGVSGYVGNRSSPSEGLQLWHVSDTSMRFDSGDNTNAFNLPKSDMGIISANRIETNLAAYRRMASSRVLMSGWTASIVPIGGANILNCSMGYITGVISSAPLGSYGSTIGLTDAQDEAFTANLKTLWEDCTLLTLPA